MILILIFGGVFLLVFQAIRMAATDQTEHVHEKVRHMMWVSAHFLIPCCLSSGFQSGFSRIHEHFWLVGLSVMICAFAAPYVWHLLWRTQAPLQAEPADPIDEN
jgi:hypothetical protein